MIEKVIETLLAQNARRATKYVSPTKVITATRRVFRGKILKRDNPEVVLKIGRPNYREREFIKLCQKVGERFPVKKIQLQFPAR